MSMALSPALRFEALGDVLGSLHYMGSCPCGRQHASTHDQVMPWRGVILCESCGRKVIAARESYPSWQQSYSNEGFDRLQQLASELTETDRKAGRATVNAGYSRLNVMLASIVVDDARRP
jgi:hypothetical protein